MKELLGIYPFSLALRVFENEKDKEEQALNLCISNLPAALGLLAEKEADILQKCRKAPCFSYGDIRHNLLKNIEFLKRFIWII